MKKVIAGSLAGLLLAVGLSSYADPVRVTAVNQMPARTQLIFTSLTSAQRQVFALSSAAAMLFSVDYRYPAAILMQSNNRSFKPCRWTNPPVGKQTIRLIDLSISIDKSTNTPICLINWR